MSLLGAFSNLYNAQNILDKQSLSTPDSLGKQIASPLISIYDNPLHEGNVSGETFDGEGTPTRNLPIIEKGVLVNFLHSSVTAKRMNATPTGHANIGAKVTISPNYHHVMPGETPSSQYSLDTADNVILIDELQALHAGVNPLQGSFSLPFDGWLIKNGEKISCDSATVAGDFLQLLQSIIFVEDTPQITPAGVSPVSGLIPSLLLDNNPRSFQYRKPQYYNKHGQTRRDCHCGGYRTTNEANRRGNLCPRDACC